MPTVKSARAAHKEAACQLLQESSRRHTPIRGELEDSRMVNLDLMLDLLCQLTEWVRRESAIADSGRKPS